MGDGNWATGAISSQRLSILQKGGTGGGIAGMADSEMTGEVMEDIASKNLGDEAHPFVLVKLPAVGSDDSSALLAAVLEGV